MDSKDLDAIIEKHQLWLTGMGGERANLRGANLGGADLVDANLGGADLRGANLRGANLVDANLAGCAGNRSEIKSIFASEKYPITYTSEYLQIGCQRHPIAEWWEFSDKKISDMDYGALEFWNMWKPIIKTIIEQSPAVRTKHEAEEQS